MWIGLNNWIELKELREQQELDHGWDRVVDFDPVKNIELSGGRVFGADVCRFDDRNALA